MQDIVPLCSLSISTSDPSRFASGSCDASVRLWDLRDARHPVATYRSTSRAADINAVSVLSDGCTLVAGAEDGVTALYDIRSRHCLQLLPHPQVGIHLFDCEVYWDGFVQVDRRLRNEALLSLLCLTVILAASPSDVPLHADMTIPGQRAWPLVIGAYNNL